MKEKANERSKYNLQSLKSARDFIFNSAIFISALVTIAGVIYIGSQIELTSKQLQEINSKANIKIAFHQATTTIQVGPQFAGPFDFSVVPRNDGKYTTSFWRIYITFCTDINISKSGQDWLLLDPPSNGYVYQSNKPLISIPNTTGYFFSDALDSVGDFQIYIPSSMLIENTPIATVFSSGEKTNAKYTLVMLSEKGFSYKDIYTNKGRLIPPEVDALVDKCRPVVYGN